MTRSSVPEVAHPVWEPFALQLQESAVARFARWCAETGATEALYDYPRLQEWSARDVGAFWQAIWTYYGIDASQGYDQVLSNDPMPHARWFAGSRLNYVDHVFRSRQPEDIAVIDAREVHPAVGASGTLTWQELERQVRSLAASLRELGVEQGDRVAGYVSNCPQAVVAFLATASLGAVWSSCGQDYSPAAALARFSQLQPKVLICTNGYVYGGKVVDRGAETNVLIEGLGGLRGVVVIERLLDEYTTPILPRGQELLPWGAALRAEGLAASTHVEFSSPLWVLFSSGTTGKPKGIVHGHGGVVLEHLKALNLQLDLGEGDVFFWYTSTSWMVWNYLVSSLMTGASIVCYDGSPTFPTPDALWRLADEHRVSFLGTSPAFLMACQKAEMRPAQEHDLSRLRLLGSSGSNLPASCYPWILDRLGARVQVMSTTGGTDVVSAFAGAVPTMPVWAGELSAPCLGVALDSWDAMGRSVRDGLGELVVLKPMPSMPLYFWGDDDGSLLEEAYFSMFPGVWRHGDWITLTDRNTVVMHGRSDSTLNRNGVRMGSADIYEAVETLREVKESLVVGIDGPNGSYWMPLFVALEDGHELTDALVGRIRAAIKNGASPRHVPDVIIEAPAIPHTRTGKKLEIPVKRILAGAVIDDVVDRQSVDAPDLLNWYASIGATQPHSNEVTHVRLDRVRTT